MSEDVSFRNLLDLSLDSGDPFLAAACHPYADSQDRSALESILVATSKLKRDFAGAAYTPASVLGCLARDSDKRIRLRVAKHPAATPAILAELARVETAEDLCARVAGHRNTPRSVLEDLYNKHPNSSETRRALCYNPRTPLSLLRRLARCAAAMEFKGIARSPQADKALLRRCWEQRDTYLRAEVAAHPNCPSDLRDSAERAPQAVVRRKLAQNPVLPDTVLLRLLGDAEAQVRAAAVRHLSAPLMAEADSGDCDPSRQVRRDQARQAGLPLLWIDRLAADTDSWVRRLIARNQAVPEDTLYRLAEDAITEVRRGVARNPVCPADLLARLARDPHPWVRAGVALRDDIAELLIIELSRDNNIDVLSALGRNPSTPPKILEHIAHHENHDIRRAVILNRNTPHYVLCGLVEDPYPLNRVLLADHLNVGNADLHVMLRDPEPAVRFAGARELAARLN